MYRKKERAFKEERTTLPQRRRTPSFSSSLLDAICRSIDEDPAFPSEETLTTCKKHSNSAPPSRGRTQFLGEEDNNNNNNNNNKEMRSLRRAIMVDTWMERQKSQRTTSSSDSSRGGGGGLFSSSSETGSSSKGTPRPGNGGGFQGAEKKQPKSEKDRHPQGLDFSRTKLRALKIYGELKKVKQPISPGGRISSFLNSIFSPGSATKKEKMCSIGAMEDISFGDDNYTTTKVKSSSCSTSSFSRSCLSSKAPTPGRRSKRSVRFYPVSVIVGEDSRPCGHKYIYGGDRNSDPLVISKESKKKTKKKLSVNVHFPSYLNYDGEEEEDDDDDDDMSCSSSELFEIDHHLIGIGNNGRFREELPVYETTSLKTNQAIANGFFV